MRKVLLVGLTIVFSFCINVLNAQNNKDRLKESRLIGLWILERAIMDNNGNKIVVYPGNFKIVTPDGHYTIFVYNNRGGLITSEGDVVIDSDSTYIEKIKYNLNTTLNNKEVRQLYKIVDNKLHQTFFIERNNFGGDYNRWETEVWKRVELPEVAKKSIDAAPTL